MATFNINQTRQNYNLCNYYTVDISILRLSIRWMPAVSMEFMGCGNHFIPDGRKIVQDNKTTMVNFKQSVT